MNPIRFKLAAVQVDEIRAALRAPAPRPTQEQLARRYGVSQPTISAVHRGVYFTGGWRPAGAA